MQTDRAVLAAAAALVISGCAPDAIPTAPVALSPRAVATPASAGALLAAEDGSTATRRRLERAAEGLLYTSESDYPFEYFFQAAAVHDALTSESFRAAVGVPADSLVEEVSVDAFFARHIELADPNDAVAQSLVPRFRRLEQTIQRSVRHARVYRVGQILIRCYVVGTDGEGNVVGLTTFAVET